MQIILIRHGQTLSNKQNDEKRSVFIGQYDTQLTDLGYQQAKSLQNNELFENVDMVYCSTLLRAKTTLSCFYQKDNIIYDARLKERSLGDFESHEKSDIEKQYPDYFTNPELIDFAHSFKAKAPNGENYFDVCQRVNDFLNEIKSKNYQKVVIVSHFCTIRCIVKIIQNISEEETLNYKIYHCKPIILNY